ncbi:NfeD family protein [Rickettsia oklahomensis]|uniref:NfeD family protein n=1 Tax=Rickettsia oklahomensis TaxID=3141789 RepID=A0AAU7BXE3_9RICK
MFMINNYPTNIWLIIGLICLVIELFTVSSIVFLFFGLGALSNTLMVYNYNINLQNQIMIFSILSLIWFIILYLPLKKYVYSTTAKAENYSDMVGKTVEIHSSTISSHTIGQVKWSGVIMNAYLAPNEEAAKKGDHLFIIAVKGNILICSRHKPNHN